MQHRIPILASAALVVALAATPALGQAGAKEMMHVVPAKSLVWADAEIPGFAPGMKMAAIHGDPAAEGAYTLRLSFPDGYRFPAHWHPNTENLTVLTGTLLLTMGEKADPAMSKAYGVGDYLNIPGKMPHSGGARGYTVIQLHGEGPFTIHLVEPPK